MSLLGECLLPYMFLVLIRELNASYLHEIMYSIHYFQLKRYTFLCCNNHMDQNQSNYQQYEGRDVSSTSENILAYNQQYIE